MIPQLTVYTKILYLLMVVIAGSLCSREQVHLYSKCANRFVGIHEGKVVANDDPVTSQTISISDQISKGIIFAPLKLTLFIEEVKMYLCFNKRWRLVPSKKLHEYCYFSEHMEEGYHRFKSVTDDTKHIGFTATGRQMAFRNRTIHNENCYSFTKITPKQLKASKAAAAETTATVSSTAFAKPKVAHTSLNGMSTGETQHRHHQNHHLHRQQQPQQRHKQHHQHQQQQQHKKQPHQSHHKSARKTPSIPKLQSYNNNNRNATNRNLINNNRAASSNLSTLTPRTNSKNSSNNNNNSSNRSSFRDISSSNTSVTTSDGLASSNSNGYNISDRYGNRSSISERISNSSIISSVNRTHKNKTQINLSHKHHLRHRHSQTKPQTKHQLPFHVQSQQQSSSSSTVKNFHNFQSDQSEQQRQQQQQHPQQQHKPDIFEQEQEQEQRNRNERKVVSFYDNIDSVRRSHINHRSPHNSHSFHYLQKNVDLVVPNETAAAVANDRQRLTMAASSAAKPSALDVPHKKDFRTKKKSHLDKHSLVGGTPPKLNDPYLHHRHRHHHGDHQPPKTIDQQSLTLPHYLDKMTSTKKTKHIHHHQQQHHNRPQEEDIV